MWEREKESLGDAWEGGDHQFVFHSGTGKPYYYTTPTSKWSKFAKKLDLKYIRLHDLRHTMVTLLIEEEAKMNAIQKRTGHANLKVLSDTYSHFTPKWSRRLRKNSISINQKIRSPKSVPNS